MPTVDKRRYRAGAVSVAVLVGGLATPALAADLRAMLLRPSDAPSGFTRQIIRHYSLSELAGEGTYSESDLRRWGYQGGWEAQYTRGVDTHRDPAQLSSNVGQYRHRSGARASLASNRARCSQGPWTRLTVAQVGQQTVACTRTGDVRGHPAAVFFVVWRCSRYKGSITLSAARGRYGLDDAVSLARRQATHMPC